MPGGIWRQQRWRAWFAVALAVVMAAVGGVTLATAASAASVDTSEWYVLVNRNSGKVLDVTARSTADGAAIVQYRTTGGTNQQWQFVDTGDGYYKIRSRNSGKVLDVTARSTADGAAIVQYSDNGGANQRFRLADSDGGDVRLINKNSGKAVDVAGASTADGAKVVQNGDTGANNQQWQLARVGASTAPSEPATVWLAGDSTVANSSGGSIVGWGRELSGYLTPDATVVNSAVGGRSVQTWLYESAVTSGTNSAGECLLSSTAYATRWQSMLAATTGMQAGDWLLIQFGINDGSPTCPRHVGSARYRELLTAMVTAARQRGAHPILITPVAALTCSGSTAVPNRGFLTETFDVGTATGTPVVDLHKLSYTYYNSQQFCPFNGDYTAGAAGAFFADDHTHVEAAGARQIAGLVTRAVRDQGLGLAAYVR